MSTEKEEILSAACKLGRSLLENGGEIYRIEESINFFLKAYGICDGQIFAIPATIIVTIIEDEKPLTQVERIKATTQNLDKLDKLNALCRNACKEKPDIKQVKKELAAINSETTYPFSFNLIAFGVISAFFCLFWGGNIKDAVAAFVCGLATKYCLRFMDKFKSNIFFTNLITSALIGYIAIIFIKLGYADNIDKIIIGAIMTLVPGVAITNVMRDIIAGDIITGTTKISEVLLVALAIAIGVAIAISGIITGGGM